MYFWNLHFCKMYVSIHLQYLGNLLTQLSLNSGPDYKALRQHPHRKVQACTISVLESVGYNLYAWRFGGSRVDPSS